MFEKEIADIVDYEKKICDIKKGIAKKLMSLFEDFEFRVGDDGEYRLGAIEVDEDDGKFYVEMNYD